MSTATTSPPVRFALAYAQRFGWHVFPCYEVKGAGCSCPRGAECERAGKHPRTRGGLKDATTHDGTIRAWWASAPRANVAVATGPESGLAVLDVDELDALGAIVEQHGPFPDTPRARTGRGGLHFFFRWPVAEAGHKGPAPVVRSLTAFPVQGCDTRGAGGYVLLPPSSHVSGNPYRWEVSRREMPLAPAPSWLIAAPAPAGVPADLGPIAGEMTPYGSAALRGELERLAATPVGQRNAALNRAAFALGRLRCHVPPGVAAHALFGAAAGIGLAPNEIAATLRSGFDAGTKAPAAGPEVKP